MLVESLPICCVNKLPVYSIPIRSPNVKGLRVLFSIRWRNIYHPCRQPNQYTRRSKLKRVNAIISCLILVNIFSYIFATFVYITRIVLYTKIELRLIFLSIPAHP